MRSIVHLAVFAIVLGACGGVVRRAQPVASDVCDARCRAAVDELVEGDVPRSWLGFGAQAPDGDRVWYTLYVDGLRPGALDRGDGVVVKMLEMSRDAPSEEIRQVRFVGCGTNGSVIIRSSCRYYAGYLDLRPDQTAVDQAVEAHDTDGAGIVLAPLPGNVLWWSTENP